MDETLPEQGAGTARAPARITKSRVFRSVNWREDPLRLLGRIPTALYSMWVRNTYPFASIGSKVQFHPTWDFRRYLAHRVKLGDGVQVGKDVHFGVYCGPDDHGEPMIVIESGTVINRHVQISARNCIHIERKVLVSPFVLIMDHNHEFSDITNPIMDQGLTLGGRIRIEEGCWIGRAAAIVCNSSELVIGRNSIVAANALVTKSIPPNSVVVGNPARVTKQYDPEKGKWIP